MSEPYIGEINIFAGNFAPRGWHFCDGTLLQISQYSALFSILGTIYGGDGRTNFALPNLKLSGAIGAGQGPGLPNHPLGQVGGAENITLSTSEIAPHSHQLTGTNNADNSVNPTGAVLSRPNQPIYIDAVTSSLVNLSTNSIGDAGGGSSHDNMQPYLAVNFIIALEGVFPSQP
ncbi:microcystin-dependent protein [Xenococcus sp. PCC 7305]|uniref:phage tail protein n=1 Tax=Xenococcus sp. PCC 7305 TaxID=102125 RepID=UPI0002AC64FE|nr:tail fiber protein [Xenococcus sp. PCC 7305]ELS05340.1 microcystin-dependent protein [Xenococcus sp. PCC 7305]